MVKQYVKKELDNAGRALHLLKNNWLTDTLKKRRGR